MILRLVAIRLGLTECSGLVKRAIQFGSRIAQSSNKVQFGSNTKGKGTHSFAMRGEEGANEEEDVDGLTSAVSTTAM